MMLKGMKAYWASDNMARGKRYRNFRNRIPKNLKWNKQCEQIENHGSFILKILGTLH